MILIYNTFIFFYCLAIKLVVPFHQKARKWVAGRNNLIKEVRNSIRPSDEIIWFHCASLGEFEQAKPLIERIKTHLPKKKICITFFSPSGYENCKNQDLIDYVFYLPADTKSNAEKFVSALNPEKVFFVKYEVWYHFYQTIYSKRIPLYLFSANFRKDQRFFKWYGSLFRKALSYCEHIFTQTNESKNLLQNINIKKVSVSGDTRIDRVYSIAQNTKKIIEVEAFKGNSELLVAGSSWPEEEKLLRNFADAFSGKMVIAPHEINETHLQFIENLFSNNCIRFSCWKANAKAKVLLIDNIGLLSSIYQYADIALVGGGFSGKLHNILEPIAHGCAIVVGPKYHNYPEAKELIDKGLAYSISNPDQLEKVINQIQPKKPELTQNAKTYVNEKMGATELIFQHCFN